MVHFLQKKRAFFFLQTSEPELWVRLTSHSVGTENGVAET